MLGAITGDIIGSIYEFNGIKTKDFPLFSPEDFFTDDTVMTAAVAAALLDARTAPDALPDLLTGRMRELGGRYPGRGYGGRFAQWLVSPVPRAYNSFGNGSAMRVSPCGLYAVSLDEALALAAASASVTHNHPEGVRGAQAVAAAVFLARAGKTKDQIGAYLRDSFYPLDRTLDEIRGGYRFDETCQGSVPQALQAFLESDGYEDALRGAVSLGGDSDTQAAIAGSIARAYYARRGDPDVARIDKLALAYLPEEFRSLARTFAEACEQRSPA